MNTDEYLDIVDDNDIIGRQLRSEIYEQRLNNIPHLRPELLPQYIQDLEECRPGFKKGLLILKEDTKCHL